jgi:hypothetical protein
MLHVPRTAFFRPMPFNRERPDPIEMLFHLRPLSSGMYANMLFRCERDEIVRVVVEWILILVVDVIPLRYLLLVR